MNIKNAIETHEIRPIQNVINFLNKFGKQKTWRLDIQHFDMKVKFICFNWPRQIRFTLKEYDGSKHQKIKKKLQLVRKLVQFTFVELLTTQQS